jgi:DNA-binding transcriptional ArsR family regulator
MKSGTRIARERLAVLGDASRFRIAQALAGAERCVTELAGRVGLSQSCTTRHLQAMARAGLVTGLRDGKRVVFRLRTDDPAIGALLEWALSAEPRPEQGPNPGRTALNTAPARDPRGPARTRPNRSRSDGAQPAQAAAPVRPAAPIAQSAPVDPVFDLPSVADTLAEREAAPLPNPRRTNDLEDYLL